ncbi:NAD(P)/FAD-dependent oxidoreductase [Chitinimonas sp. BJB300]|uniref:NAD(P)/FAD-dependent oxidoreductase n=1 Tax=Chitinimonas sp. BJB300 TaxID=1559339 RepID=UPI000C0EE940|nr:aminoacetone oxidase family FAD-binding enzyme [Chitinimonas sp. BJB300]TSJ88068.1 NAD(P)/FAD-dependent oxidoreductase [Chitinimonas sp. BJB300]
METDVIVIGAGAAGMMAAASASQRGRGVTLIDHSERLAEKIRISGGGRCNFTNTQTTAERYLSRNPHFCKSALAQYTAQDFIDLVNRYGIAWHEKKLGQLFCDKSAQDIIDLLQAECDLGGTVWRTGTAIQGITKTNTGFQVDTLQERWQCQSVIIATGGLSIPPIGATGFGYEIAKQFGLPITPLAAALVPLTFEPKDLFNELAGVSLDCDAHGGEGPNFRENVLFTHRGVSGPAILQISSYWRPGQEIALDLLPGRDAHALFEEAKRADTLLPNVLADWLPKRFAQAFCEAIVPIKPMKQYTVRELDSVAQRLHNWRVVPSGSQGYKKAEVTRGGVDTDALSSKTLMSKNVPGLFFVGEVVDVTGWLGGYNFQWAWSSGWVAGQYA